MNYLGHTVINTAILSGVSGLLLSHGTYLGHEVALFWILGMFHTVYMSPDVDHPNSQPTKNMGFIGKITSRTFKHRGLLHNPLFWTAVYLALGIYIRNTYGYEAWWFSGGLIAIYTHVALDKLKTGVKREKRRIKRSLHL